MQGIQLTYKAKSVEEVVVGIDFGTTSSVAAYVKDGKPFVLAEMPSVVSILKTGEVVAGRREAESIWVESIKRFIGKDPEEIPNLTRHSDVQFIKLSSGHSVLRVAETSFHPFELAGKLLAAIKSEAELVLNALISAAVLTVPAYFDNKARREIFLAAQLAGINVLRIVTEPTAAAYAYGLQDNSQGSYLVYDFGGGTFDVSLLVMKDGIFRVLGVDGDSALGGDDLDFALAKHIRDARQAMADNCFSIQELLKAAKDSKEALWKRDSYTIALNADCKKPIELELNLGTLNSLALPLVKRTVQIAERLFAKCSSPKLDGIILVGGSSKLRAVFEHVSKAFPLVPIMSDVDPERIVAFGAAWQARNLSCKGSDLLIDVVPLSLGLELADGFVDVLVPRNSSLPACASRVFTTGAHGQTKMQFNVVQGEREQAKDCISLAKFTLEGIPSMPRGEARVEVNFALDVNGVLSVRAREMSMNNVQEIAVHSSYGLDQEEINRLLMESIQHAQEDFNLRTLASLEQSSKDLISSIYGLTSAEALQSFHSELADQIEKLQKALESKAQNDIKTHLTALRQKSAEFFSAVLNSTLKDKVIGRKLEEISSK